MAILLCQQYPQLQIYNPVTKDFFQFRGGKLEISEGDPNYEVAMAEASRNPAIRVITAEVQCLHCGDKFGDSTTSAARLAEHVKQAHFEIWEAAEDADHAARIHAELKARASHFCDVCRPMQEFGEADTLAAHVAMFHTAPPAMDDDGNILGDGGGPAAVVTEIPAAKPSKRR